MAVKHNDTTERDMSSTGQVPATSTPSWVNIPAFKSLPSVTGRVELVLFGWALLLYRRNYGTDVHFTCKLCDGEGLKYSAFDMRTKEMHWDAGDALSLVLQKAQAYIRANVHLVGLPDAANCTFFLNDENAPSDQTLGTSTEKCESSITWVSAS